MTPEEHQRCAAELLAAEASGQQTGLLSLRFPHMEMSDAYEIQKAIYQAKLVQGRRVIGWKIGLTSKAMQSALQIDVPDSGILFDDMQFDSGAHIEKNRFIQPRIESEIAFIMKTGIGGEHVTRDEVLTATDYVAPAIEILDTRIRRKDPATGQARLIVDTISDNAANAGIVLGPERHPIGDLDLRWVGVLTYKNNEIEETGLGAGVLNDPVESVVWLCRRMAQYGQSIEPGHIILSGSFIRPVECPSGSHILADFGTFGSVELFFD